jgi:hypothetical protein
MTSPSEVPSEPALAHRLRQLAFEYWNQRGCPYRAEQEIQKQINPYTLHETWHSEPETE